MFDINEFRDYYETHAPTLIAFAGRFVSDEMGEDIIHDVFLEIWENIPITEQLPNPSYLFTAVRNRCLNVLKREDVKNNYISYIKTENQRMELAYYNSIEKTLIEKEEIQEIHRQIELLPEKCRQIFKLAYFEDIKTAEIAEKLGLSVRTVEHQLYLGLRTLREKLHVPEKRKQKFFIFF